MKTIVCYGDSNTWGYDPVGQNRFSFEVRWPGVMRKTLGVGYWIIEEGLGGRTTVFDDPIELHRNGRTYLTPCLLSHRPFDLITIMLGTNDLKARFNVPAADIARGAGALVEMVQKSDAGINDRPPKVLLICPPPIAPLAGTRLADMFTDAEAKSRELAQHYRNVALELGCDFMNAGDVITSSPVDAIHFEANEHRKLGEAVAARVRDMLAD